MCEAECGRTPHVEDLETVNHWALAEHLEEVSDRHGVCTAAVPYGTFTQGFCDECWSKLRMDVKALLFEAWESQDPDKLADAISAACFQLQEDLP